MEDAEGLEGDDVEVVGDTEMNLIFEELCADDSDEVDDPDLQPMPLPEEKRQKLFEVCVASFSVCFGSSHVHSVTDLMLLFVC